MVFGQLSPLDAKEFGFTAVVLTAVLVGIAFFARHLLNDWLLARKEQRDRDREEELDRRRAEEARRKAEEIDREERRRSDIELRTRLVDAQVQSYKKNVETAEIGLELTRKMSQATEMMAISSQMKEKMLTSIDKKHGSLHKAFRDALAVACDFIPDHPEIRKKLHQIADNLKDE